MERGEPLRAPIWLLAAWRDDDDMRGATAVMVDNCVHHLFCCQKVYQLSPPSLQGWTKGAKERKKNSMP